MKRILLIEPALVARETIALLLARDYELDQRDSFIDAATLARAATGADLVIASAGPSAWTAQLARLNIAVLLLSESQAAAQFFVNRENFKLLIEPFNPYDLKAAVASLVHRAEWPAAQHGGASSDLEFPFLTHAAADLARRFACLSLPLLIWGERGCGQDRVARAMLSESARAGLLMALNGRGLTADTLEHQRAQMTALGKLRGAEPAVLIEGLERLAPFGQASLLNWIEAIEGSGARLRLIATANVDLLEPVYRGEFLERLYYKLAKLTLPLAPLRERRADLPALAQRIAADYLAELNLRDVDFTAAALARLGNYLWFGNLDEFDLVIARTLAIQGKARIDAADIVFDVSALLDGAGAAAATVPAATASDQPALAQRPRGNGDFQQPSRANGGAAGAPNLRLLVHELAHELKNPMVTIKTFAQLLAERYDDASFRASFQDVVDGDIERMNEILAVMTEYAGFDQPHKASTVLVEHLSSTLEAIQEDCAKRQIHVGWKENGHDIKIMADAVQLRYALRNTLLAILAQARAGSEIELALADSGALAISYLREGEPVQSLGGYFRNGDLPAARNIVPLRIILAREIVERSGGRFCMDQVKNNRDIVTMEFPVA